MTLRPVAGAPLVLAHRGAAAVAPENTWAAIARAIDLGADGVEIDVQRTSDGVLVLVHDDDWRRTTGIAAPVRTTPWERVRAFDAGSWFGAEFRGTPPPTLQAALEQLPDATFVDIEIKSPERDAGLGAAVLAAVRPHAARLRVLLTSFDHGCIESLAAAAAGVECGFLSDTVLEPRPGRWHQALAHAALLAQPAHVERVHRAGALVFAWTVDDPAVARRLAELGVDGIITNDPGCVRSALRRQ